MQIIPVLDLYRGSTVRAIKGHRKNYQPIKSHICPSSNPMEIINYFLRLYDFKCIYIADLDALLQQGNNINTIESICQAYPKLEIWLDTGPSLIKYYLEDCEYKLLRMILSTESINSLPTFTSLINNYTYHHFILSIDYKSGKILGPNKLVQMKEQWPTDVLILNLDCVGSNDGINIPIQLNHHSLFQTHNIYYGGGIRNCKDLHKLKTLGAAGALISSSLHSEAITRNDLFTINQ